MSPIESFYTDRDSRALCMTFRVAATADQTDALVRQLRRTGNVLTVDGGLGLGVTNA